MEPVPDWGTVPRMVLEQAARHPDVPVLDGVTYAGLLERALAVAGDLLALGIERGDRVAVWGLNDAAWVVRAVGVWLAGAVIVPLSARFKALEAADVLARTGAKALLAADGFTPPDGFPHLLTADGSAHLRTPEGSARLRTPRPVRRSHRAAVLERAGAVEPTDLCEIMSTSGTTGTPKGVMLDHAQVLRGYWDWAEIVGLRAEDRYPVIAPFAHGFGLNAGLLACLLRRAAMIPVPVFRPELIIDLLESRKITVLAGPPTLFHRLLDELDRAPHDFSSLRVAICGAAVVPPELVRRLLDRTGLERMINAYGLMEGTVVSMTRAEDPVEVVAGTAGRPVPGIEVKVVDPAGHALPAGERGEILQRGYGVMRGYWDDPVRTAEVIDADGWLHTGDVGYLDPSGNVVLVDRLKELYIVNGFNVSPAEVEALLLREGSLAQVAVVGVPDARSGEAGWAFAVPRPGQEVDAAAVLGWARRHLSSHKVPKHLTVVEELPLNATGKVDKQALRRLTAS
ncbi:AMP-binding protein [Nonomuraea sp. NPDC050310]|uniref:AMP-binding protein n=1 Tax=Nonomuraea sp. NPDC050310 TaxID=3154935 RepID=UPI0033F16727